MTTKQIAEAFVAGKTAKYSTAEVRNHPAGTAYFLHGNQIAVRFASGRIVGDWCGWHTSTTARHLNAICAAANSAVRVSYAAARAAGDKYVTIVAGARA